LDEDSLDQSELARTPAKPVSVGDNASELLKFAVWTFPVWWNFAWVFFWFIATVGAHSLMPSTQASSFVKFLGPLYMYIPMIFAVILLVRSAWFRTTILKLIPIWLLCFIVLWELSGLTQGVIASDFDRVEKSIIKQIEQAQHMR
jgi:hypothetical protein